MIQQTHTSTSDLIVSERLAIGRKLFFLDLKENQRGRFVKITEDDTAPRKNNAVPAERERRIRPPF